jgi:hypothetical protein
MRSNRSRLAALALAAAGAWGCGKSKAPPPPAPAVKALGISPRGFPLDYTGLPAFLAEAGSFAHGGVVWNGAWRDDALAGSDAGTVPAAAAMVQASAAANGYTPVAVFGWRTGSSLLLQVPADATDDWTNAAARALFLSMLSGYAASYRPAFVFLGNENDFYFEQAPADYANWLAFYAQAYGAVKAASPATMVGPVFSHEHLAGSGALNGWTAPHWGAIDGHDFAKVDVVGITLYPWLQHATAAAVPDGYLDGFLAHAHGKPIAITETGWPAENLGGLDPPWETSDPAQVTYLARLAAMLRGKDVRLATWLFLHPEADPGGSPTEWKLFGSVSLRDNAGIARPAYASWQALAP